ncbi:MAG TPA: methyltransferase domain-containing protein [Alphaproteobacteria bacterium]
MTEPYAGIAMLEVIAEAVNYNTWLAETVVTGLAHRSPVVDFGAGSGTFSRMVRDRGAQVVCVEPDPTLAARLRGDGFDVHGSLAALPDAAVPAVYSLNVLEHIEDDAAALRELNRILSPGGRLLLYVPAFPILYSSFDARYGHQRRYRKSALRSRVAAAGFRVVACRYADSLGFFAALAFRALDSGAGTVSMSAVRVYDRALFPVSRQLDRLCGGVFGKNVLLVAEKA